MDDLYTMVSVRVIELVELAKIVSELDDDLQHEQRIMLINDAHSIIETMLAEHAGMAYAQESAENKTLFNRVVEKLYGVL